MTTSTHKPAEANRIHTVRLCPFVFTGKERDPLRLYLQSGELCRARLTSPPDLLTGYSYLPHQARQAQDGARYLEHDLMSMWLSVDPMSDKYPSLSPYAYCAWNPVKLVDPDGCSGVPSINKKTKTITITSKLYFYGPQATPELSRAIATGIASQWNAAGATYELNGETYKVRFGIFYETVSEAKARRLAENNTDPKNNFIKVERGPKGKSSYTKMHDGISGYGGNSFWFNTRDDLENSTTPSHEYGHGMGLNHPTEDYSNSTERPDIMIPRNALYGTRWSIENEDGERVVNTNSRKVLPQNVQDAIDYGCGDVNNIIIK